MKTIDSFRNRVLHGDCIDVLREVPADSVDFVLTDPPYLVRYTTFDGQPAYPNDDHERWLKPAFAEIYRVLKPDKYCACFYGWKKVERFMWAWKNVGFRPVSHLVWVKDYCSRKEHTQWHHDNAYLLAKGKPPKPVEPVSDVFEWRYGGCFEHPAQRPVNTLTPLIAAFSQPDDLVLDPFAGSGSTGLAARVLKRNYLLIEMVEKYHRIAARRLLVKTGGSH